MSKSCDDECLFCTPFEKKKKMFQDNFFSYMALNEIGVSWRE